MASYAEAMPDQAVYLLLFIMLKMASRRIENSLLINSFSQLLSLDTLTSEAAEEINRIQDV